MHYTIQAPSIEPGESKIIAHGVLDLDPLSSSRRHGIARDWAPYVYLNTQGVSNNNYQVHSQQLSALSKVLIK